MNCLECINLKKEEKSFPTQGDICYCEIINKIFHTTRKLIFKDELLNTFYCSEFKNK